MQTTLQLLKGYEAQKSNEAFGSVQTHKILVDFGLCEVMTERNIATKPVFLTYAEVGCGACAGTHVHMQASGALCVVKNSGLEKRFERVCVCGWFWPTEGAGGLCQTY